MGLSSSYDLTITGRGRGSGSDETESLVATGEAFEGRGFRLTDGLVEDVVENEVDSPRGRL